MFPLIVAVFLLALYFRHHLTYWKRKNVYCEYFIFDFLKAGKISVSEYVMIYYKRVQKKLEKHTGFYFPLRPYYMPVDLDIVQNVLVKDFQFFGDRLYEMRFNDIIGDSLPFLPKERWKVIRKKITPVFSTKSIKNLLEIFIEHGDEMKNHIDNLILKKEPINLNHVIKSYVINSTGQSVLGIDCNCFSNKHSDFIVLHEKSLHMNFFHLMRLLLVLVYPKISTYFNISLFPTETIDFYTKLVGENVMKREEEGEGTERWDKGSELRQMNDDILQRLIDLKNKAAHETDRLSMRELISQATLLFNAGIDTVCPVIMFSLFELAHHQDIQQRVRKEIIDTLKDSDFHNSKNLNYDTLQEMTYMNQVIEETMRKYPSAPFLMRCCANNYKVPGEDLVLEKGTMVIIPVHGIHHDPKYYPNPDRFDPERFTEVNKRGRHPSAFLPLGAGPRNCPGGLLGKFVIKIALVKILKNFNLTLNEKTKYPAEFATLAMLITPKNPILLNARKVHMPEIDGGYH